MLFEAFDREGKRTMYTSDKSCVPDRDQFQSRIRYGESFKLDGKVIKSYDKLQEGLRGK